MQFLLLDLALAFAALLGYRALGTVGRRDAPVVVVDARAPLRERVAPRPNPGIASRGPLPRESELPREAAPSGPTQQRVRRAPQHRLINFW